MSYNLTLNNQQLQLSLARTGGQGSKGDSVTSASIDSNGDFHIIISNAAGQQVQDINLGGATIIAQATAAKTAAEAALDTFDDRFLGVKSSAPGLDNDNDALVTGALYFDSTISHLGVYNGSTWIYPLQAAQTSATAAAASQTAAATSATNAATSETNAGTSATNAANSAAQAASSESTVAASATTASTAATNALASQSAAATSAANAATSETNAGTSETNAGNSATSAASDATYSNNRATAAAASAAAALVSENNSATSESSAASSATTAGNHSSNAAANAISAANSKTAAASSAANALNYQSGAQTAETNAGNSATAAANSASAAATSETNAASSATSAATSLASVQTVFDNFDDKFLGTKTSDPTVDNDGDALVEGAMYYNSTTDVIKFYNGTSWEAPSTAASNSATAAATSATNAASSATNAASSATASANSAAASLTSANNAAASYDSFDDRYLGAKATDPTVDNDGDALVTGAIYFDTTNDVMKVYNGTDWQNASSSIEGIKTDFIYTATANQTVFSGSDNNSNILAIDKAGLLSLFMNGIRLIQGTDYTVNVGGDSVTLTSGAAANDVIEIQVFGNFTGQSGAEVAITGGSITGLSNLGMSGSTTVTGILDEDNMASNSDVKLATQQSIKAYVDAQVGTVDTLAEVLGNGNTTGGTDIAVSAGDDITFADTSKAIFGAGSDLWIYSDGTDSYIEERNGTGSLYIDATDLQLRSTANAKYFRGITGGAVDLYYDNASKLATTSTGIDITGTVTADGLTVDDGDILLDSSTQAFLKLDRGTAASHYALTRYYTGGTEEWRTGTYNDASSNFYVGTPSGKYLSLTSGGDISFYEDTGTTAKFFWDASAESLGIGTSSPLSRLTVQADASANGINIVGRSGGQEEGWLFWYKNNASTLNAGILGDNQGLKFATGSANTERMRIDSSGAVVINNSGGDAQLYFGGTSGTSRMYLARAGLDSLLWNVSSGNMRFGTNNTERMRIDSSGNVGIGDGTLSHTSMLHIYKSLGTADLALQSAGSSGRKYILQSKTDGSLAFYDNNASTERMRIDSSGRVGIGGIPNTNWRNDIANQEVLMLGTEATFFADSGVTTELWNNAYVDNSDVFKNISTRGASRYFQYQGAHKWFTAASASAGSNIGTEINSTPKMTLDVSGNLLVGNSTTGLSSAGINLHQNGTFELRRDLGSQNVSTVGYISRGSTDGSILQFYKDTSHAGSIGTSGVDLTIGTGDVGLKFNDASNRIDPWNVTTNTSVDGTFDLGKDDRRFKDLYLSNAVVQNGVKATTTATTQVAIETFAHASHDGAKVVITAATSADTYVTELLIATNGTTAVATEYGQVGTGSALATYDVDISGANVRILATPASTTSTTFRVAMTLT